MTFPAPIVCAPPPAPPRPFADALTAPTAGQLLPSIIAQTPRGPAWRTDETQDADDNSFQHRFWTAVATPVAWLYGKLWKLALASTACTLSGPEDPDNDALEDWEAEWGLPDPCTAFETFPVAQRKIILRSKIMDQGGQSIAYFTCLAASLGYSITVDEYIPFRCGVGRCGKDGIGLAINEVFWRVNITTPTVSYFRCGQGRCGLTPLGAFGRHLDLECMLDKWKPAHTQIVFRYRYTGGANFSRSAYSGNIVPLSLG
jgi:uncharacterized protein YmfQ (DUF2313 family)